MSDVFSALKPGLTEDLMEALIPEGFAKIGEIGILFGTECFLCGSIRLERTGFNPFKLIPSAGRFNDDLGVYGTNHEQVKGFLIGEQSAGEDAKSIEDGVIGNWPDDDIRREGIGISTPVVEDIGKPLGISCKPNHLKMVGV